MSGRHYPRDPGPDADRTFDPSTPRAWLGLALVIAVLVAVAATGAHCDTRPAATAVQP